MNLCGAFPRTFACFVLCSVHSANAQVPAPQTAPSLPAVPTNLDLLAGEIGSAPAGWLTPAAKSGFTARLVEQGPTAVARGVVLRYEGKEPPSATGDLRQRIAGKDYRNKVVRLRADVRVEPGEKVFTNLFVRDERAPGSPLTAFVDEGFRITRGDWETCEVSAAIDEDAEAVIFGMRLHGAGTAAIANVSFEVLGPVEWLRTPTGPVEFGSSTHVKRAPKSASTMSPQIQARDKDEMRPEYDFSQGVRGKHHKAYQDGTNIVFLAPDIAAVFPDSASVDQALRLLVRLSKTTAVIGSRPNKALQPTSRVRQKAKSKERARAARG